MDGVKPRMTFGMCFLQIDNSKCEEYLFYVFCKPGDRKSCLSISQYYVKRKHGGMKGAVVDIALPVGLKQKNVTGGVPLYTTKGIERKRSITFILWIFNALITNQDLF